MRTSRKLVCNLSCEHFVGRIDSPATRTCKKISPGFPFFFVFFFGLAVYARSSISPFFPATQPTSYPNSCVLSAICPHTVRCSSCGRLLFHYFLCIWSYVHIYMVTDELSSYVYKDRFVRLIFDGSNPWNPIPCPLNALKTAQYANCAHSWHIMI